ncbi:MAG: PSD1 and planctomycete cytochrome C domain-containing protein [Acidobacteriota bacterium]|nr:PSD1 and planctomycete cytochrome C domain-containing protein [Acidobacteriota bacterium]
MRSYMSPGRLRTGLLVLVAFVLISSALRASQAPAATAAAGQDATLFETKVRPMLAANCFACHGEKALAGLRVDSRDALLRGGETGPALVPGDPEKSALFKAVQHADGFPRMPRGRAKLGAADIDALAEWIRAGAVWPEDEPTSGGNPSGLPAAVSHERAITAEHRAFWAFQPLKKSRPPAVQNAAWPRTDIDRFILARLEQERLAPVAAADKLTLLRRATLDLTGLPPTPEDVDAFLADTSADAFDKVVDRLLASPRYGETWGRLWLDVARYGEDDYRSLDPMGRGFNPYPNAHLYRDWVIRAFNDDLPYDQFVTAQLAADLLEGPERVRHLPALGFLGLGPWYYDNGAVEITRADERHDRVDAVSRGFMGFTVGCARCHDHKYDPIPTKDYYGLAGVFLNTEYTEIPLAPKSVVDDYKAKEKALKLKREMLGEYTAAEARQLAETLAFQSATYMKAAWQVLGEPKKDKHQIVDREKLDYELFDRWLAFLQKKPVFYPFLKDWQAMVAKGGTAKEAEALAEAFQELLIGVVLEQREVKKENDIIKARALPTAKPKEPANLPNEFITNDDFCPGCGLELRSMTTERSALWGDVFQGNLDPDDAPGKPQRPGLLRFSGWGLEQRLGGDRRALIEGLRKDIEAMEKALPEKFAYVHGVKDVEKPVDLQVHLRGNPVRLGDTVPRGFLSVLTPERITFSKGSGRLELARTITQQPLAMRVMVNRVWKEHFGTGLVNTPSNFGINGEKPTHPELLDHLAQYFVDHGLSTKALHKEIMRSAVYQLGAGMQDAAFAKDGGNRLYWRANRHRMSAEQIRDSILFVSGSLDTRVGGPSVPLTPLADRRTVYGKVSRYKLDEFLQLFDFPSPSQTAEGRFATSVPLQRLFFMNSDFMQQHAERVAEHVADEPDDAARIAKVYRKLFGRAPTAEETKAGRDFLQAEALKQYEERRAKARMPPEKDAAATDAAPDKSDAPMEGPPADGMMAGAKPGATAPEAEKKKMLPVSIFGRYVKILMSSNEFLFVS